MGSILAFVLNGVGIASFGLYIKDSIDKGLEGVNDATYVEMIVGSGNEADSMAGKVPSVALWNEQGERLGQWKGNKHVKQGSQVTLSIPHNQGAKGAQQASYMMLSTPNNDAICISAVYVTDAKVNTAWFGDIGKFCGMSWGLSQRDIGPEHMRPSCVWLDNDGSGGINAQAMSFHIPDMVANPDRVAQYAENKDTICKSTPRFSFWGDLLPDSRIPIFEPALEYEKDASNDGLGRDKDPQRVIDKDGEFDKSVSMWRGSNSKRSSSSSQRSGGSVIPSHSPRNRRQANNNNKNTKSNIWRTQTLIVTPYQEHSARELCESSTSWGPDTVSLIESLFCDMDTKTLYPLCAADGHSEGTACFHLDSKTLNFGNGTTLGQNPDIHARGDAGAKAYANTQFW